MPFFFLEGRGSGESGKVGKGFEGVELGRRGRGADEVGVGGVEFEGGFEG